MRNQTVQQVVGILPDRFGDDQRRVRVQGPENFHAHFLRIDEPVLFRGVIGMGAHGRPALGFERAGEGGFHLRLGGPTHLVGAEAEIAVGEKVGLF